MKATRQSIVLSSLIALAIVGLALPASAIVSTQEVMKRLLGIIGAAEKLDYQVLLTQTDSVRHDQLSSMTYTLTEGAVYKVVAIGDDDRVLDIDLKVVDENDNVVGKDDDRTNVAEVTVVPKWTGRFRFVVDAYKMREGFNDAFYGLVVARKSPASQKQGGGSSTTPAKYYY